ncbi:MAG: SDR family NAD(P)-dependent oxidoreductase [Bacteroidetes bacterium]|nr:MAG: SDR family NAD(P)-dependent oxidoreductase [Bacteroidota bacterium]
MDLSGNKILITGGTSGIGFELGKELLSRGNEVILLGRNEAKLNEARRQGFFTLQCDLSKVEEIEDTVVKIQNQHPDLNMLFNNAGVQYNYLFCDEVVSPKRIDEEVQINLVGQLILTQQLLPVLRNNQKAYIINTTSGLGAFPKTDGLVYSVSKAAMRNFSKGLKYSLKGTSVKVFEFIPPVTDTGMTHGRGEKKMDAGQLVRMALKQLEKERKVITVPIMRVFLVIAFFFPAFADRILSK